MDNKRIIEKLKQAGISFAPGMTKQQLENAESLFGFRFPREIGAFLACGVPVGADFFDYRDLSVENQERFVCFQESIEDMFRFDLKNNRQCMHEIFPHIPGDGAEFDEAVMSYLQSSPRLVPFYGHRCFLDGMDDMPILSFWQPTDTIIYGGMFKNYLETEFLKMDDRIPEPIPAVGIWSDLLMW